MSRTGLVSTTKETPIMATPTATAPQICTLCGVKPADRVSDICPQAPRTGQHRWEDLGHVHDLGITISAGDVPADLMLPLRSALHQAAQAAVESWLKEADLAVDDATLERLGAVEVHAYISYDGTRECDQPHVGAGQLGARNIVTGELDSSD
jgi:hypothetical protein